ncbi:MAG TPA: patatin-like phospholipase family protein [Acetobacteraceae bacterium]|nr:patatin-like phospholipase family protein [Acetobacteraceae bacterium]
MAVDQTPLGPGEVKRWFLDTPDVAEGTFEIALVLGGTVSAGAYTAGAVDFLIEALDAFYEAKKQGTAPKHDVTLRLMAGTSGGGVNAAIAGRALAFKYPHVARGTSVDPGAQTGNPFYDVWINTLRLERFLDTSDIDSGLTSFLNGQAIDEGARQIASFRMGEPLARDWVASPLRIILTVTSLCGIPYTTSFGNGLGQSYIDHADYVRFALLYPGGTLGEPRPDELVLAFQNERVPQAVDWDYFSQFARATAAFPAGFPARALVRPANHYRYRVVPYPADPTQPNQGPNYFVRVPDWKAMKPPGAADVPDDWHFLAVDGGATNNEPIELARTSLAGLLGRNPRGAKEANRAVILIDPFAGRAALGPSGNTTLFNEFGAIATALTQQARYDSADLLLASDPTVFSRFMLTPARGELRGSEAIASGGLGAFIGFACPDFMRFDYLLGRANCQKFLREEFVLANDNPVFNEWTEGQKSDFGKMSPQGMLPVIPLFGAVTMPEVLDPWPKGKLKPERYRDAIEERFRAIFEFELSDDIARAAIAWVGAHAAQKRVADSVIDAMNAYLAKAGLS